MVYEQSPYENTGLQLAADTEAYAGHLARARELTRRAVESAIRADNKESGAIWQAIAAQREAVFGYVSEARHLAADALHIAPESEGAEPESALAFALSGETARAESLADDLANRFPVNTQIQSIWLPTIRAQVLIDKKDHTGAVRQIKSPSPVESGNIQFVINGSCLYNAYVRGDSYLASEQSGAAVSAFQSILKNNGTVWNCWTGALARLGLARANALEARTLQGADADAARTRALTAYKDFLNLWKDADPDIPIFKEAKAEYARLQ